MKLVVGLGNPETRYARTRHNVGFMVIDAFSAPFGPSWSDRWDSRFARIRFRGEDLLLQKPLTFMNLSGQAVGSLARYFRIDPADLLVIHDDLDLELGRVSVKSDGGDGGHKGVRSIIDHLGTTTFARVRVGIGRPRHPGADVVDFVLSSFEEDERAVLGPAIETAGLAVGEWVSGGVSRAQNRVNRRARPEPSCPAPDVGPSVQKEEA